MILQALCSYYRRAKNAGADVCEPGYAMAGVDGELVLDRDGGLVEANPLYGQNGKKRVRRQMEVPLPPKRSGQKPEAAFLYENVSFLFGIYEKADGAAYRFEASRAKHEEVLGQCGDEGARAVLRFFERRTPGGAAYVGVDTSLLGDPRVSVVFRLQGDTRYVHERPAVRAAWEAFNRQRGDGAPLVQCLVTGEAQPLARIHGNVSGFGADKPTLVGFNQQAFCSFGKEQGANAPVGQRAAFEYVTALNMLLQDKRHRVNLAGDRVLFWAERDAPAEENAVALLLGTAPEEAEESPEPKETLDAAQAARVKGVLESIRGGGESGAAALDRSVRFFLLGVAANKTRLVIRFFYDTSFGGLADRLDRHYRDLSVAHMKYPYPSPFRILAETAVERKRENIAPNLEGELMRSVITGLPYPQTLYQGVLRRVRAEAADAEPFRAVSPLRAGILKACINRQQNKEVLTMALNRSERDVPYLLGKLFALMERAQYVALGDLNASIADKYLNAALATPQMVFPQLMALNTKHLAKKDTPEMQKKLYFLRKAIGEVVNLLELKEDESGKFAFPASLDSNAQGKFLVGYYHQVQAFFTKQAASGETAPAEPDEQ